MITKDKVKKSRKSTITFRSKNKIVTTRKSLADLFGINKKELDGLIFQKKVRNEWQ